MSEAYWHSDTSLPPTEITPRHFVPPEQSPSVRQLHTKSSSSQCFPPLLPLHSASAVHRHSPFPHQGPSGLPAHSAAALHWTHRDSGEQCLAKRSEAQSASLPQTPHLPVTRLHRRSPVAFQSQSASDVQGGLHSDMPENESSGAQRVCGARVHS